MLTFRKMLPADAAAVRTWLAGLRGARVDVRVPARGDKAALMGTVRKNAEESLRLHKTRRASDLTQRSAALEELAEALDLPEAPLRIECYDISHTQGTHQVGSMVVFEDGAPRKSDYRRFTVRGTDGGGAADDTAAMHEVLTRRFKRLLAEQGAALTAADAELIGADGDGVPVASGPIDPATGRAKRFSYAPSLVVVDGGLPQVGAARAVSRTSASTCPSSAWPSVWRRYGCRTMTSPWSCHAPRPRSTCCSTCATSPTASPLPTTARSARPA